MQPPNQEDGSDTDVGKFDKSSIEAKRKLLEDNITQSIKNNPNISARGRIAMGKVGLAQEHKSRKKHTFRRSFRDKLEQLKELQRASKTKHKMTDSGSSSDNIEQVSSIVESLARTRKQSPSPELDSKKYLTAEERRKILNRRYLEKFDFSAGDESTPSDSESSSDGDATAHRVGREAEDRKSSGPGSSRPRRPRERTSGEKPAASADPRFPQRSSDSGAKKGNERLRIWSSNPRPTAALPPENEEPTRDGEERPRTKREKAEEKRIEEMLNAYEDYRDSPRPKPKEAWTENENSTKGPIKAPMLKKLIKEMTLKGDPR